MKLSIVVSVYNEELNVIPLTGKIVEALKDIDFEIIFIDDGSRDKTVSNIKSIISRNIKLIEFRKNYGQSAALAAGIDHAEGEYIATIDGDLQNDPSDIRSMLHKLENEDIDVVAGIRVNRKDGLVRRKIPSIIANWMIRRATGLKLRDYGCSLRVFKSEIAKELGLYGEMHRFIPLLLYMQGASIEQVPVKHHPRIHGKSKYGLGRTFKVMTDLILMLFFKKYMMRPMHLFGGIGLILLFIGVVLNAYLLVLKILGNDIWGKPLLILALITFLSGLQFVTSGILAEIQMRTYYESQNKKHYSVKRITKGEN